jgi:hypothetical protein
MDEHTKSKKELEPGNENKKEILINFLNNISEFEGNKKIVSVEIMNPYEAPMIRLLKGSIPE